MEVCVSYVCYDPYELIYKHRKTSADICSCLSSITEWDLGGFPVWLLAVKPPLKLRTSDSAYLKLVSFHLP